MTFFYKSIYNDGTSFVFSEDNAGDGSYAKIDREKLSIQEVYQDTKLLHRLHIEPGQRLILRKKVTVPDFLVYSEESQDLELNQQIKDNKNTIPQRMVIPVIIIGYQQEINDKTHQNFTAIFPDGHSESFSEWKPAPMNFIELRQEEKQGG